MVSSFAFAAAIFALSDSGIVHRKAPPLPADSALQAVQLSDAYYTRLTIHRWASYAELPMFAAEYYLGDRLLNGRDNGGWVKPAHTTVAAGLGTLFAVNTLTGGLNLIEGWKAPEGRSRTVLAHSVLMLAADAGFAVAGLIAGDAEHSDAGARRHRIVALGSIGIATVGTAIMWFRR